MFTVEKINNQTFVLRVDTELSDDEANDVAETFDYLLEALLQPTGPFNDHEADDLDDGVPF